MTLTIRCDHVDKMTVPPFSATCPVCSQDWHGLPRDTMWTVICPGAWATAEQKLRFLTDKALVVWELRRLAGYPHD